MCINNSRIRGEDLASKIYLSPVDSAVVCSNAVVLLSDLSFNVVFIVCLFDPCLVIKY